MCVCVLKEGVDCAANTASRLPTCNHGNNSIASWLPTYDHGAYVQQERSILWVSHEPSKVLQNRKQLFFIPTRKSNRQTVSAC